MTHKALEGMYQYHPYRTISTYSIIKIYIEIIICFVTFAFVYWTFNYYIIIIIAVFIEQIVFKWRTQVNTIVYLY